MFARDVWRKVDSGARPSDVLLGGALLVAAAGMLAWFEPRDPGVLIDRRQLSWWAWGASLLGIGTGLIMAGHREFLHRYAVVPGGIYLAQAAAFGCVLGGAAVAPFVYVILGLPKLLALLVLPFVERELLGRRLRIGLGVVTGLAALKSLVHALRPELAGSLRAPDLAVNLLVAWAFGALAWSVRREETIWATRAAQDVAFDFHRFNNPLHAKRASAEAPEHPEEAR